MTDPLANPDNAPTPVVPPASGAPAPPDAKPQDDKGADQNLSADPGIGKPDAGSASKLPPGAPEKYEPFQTTEESVKLEGETLTEFEILAKELNLNQEQAQKVVSLGAKMLGGTSRQQAEHAQRLISEWETQSKSDKEFGGDKLPENLATAKKALDNFATPALRELLDKTGLGNHPEVIRTFFRVGQKISEDKIVKGGGDPVAERDIGDILFPTFKKGA